MKILLQSTISTPADWVAHDHTAWPSLPKKPAPPGVLDNAPGWCHGLNVQGVGFAADHYHVRGITGGVRVTVWYDDPRFTSWGNRYARVWDFLESRPDSKLGGAINTRQSQVVFAEPAAMARFGSPPQNTVHRRWALFTPPATNVMHGILVSDQENLDHRASRALRGWREWTEGLDASELDENGLIKEQRSRGRFVRASGTRTYFQRDSLRSTGVHAARDEQAFETTTDTAGSVSESTSAASSELTFCFTTPAGEPDSSSWPTGDYRCQLDCTTSDVNMIYGLATVNDGLSGHFARVNSALTSELESVGNDLDSTFSGTGLKLSTASSKNWSTGLASDRFECLVAQSNLAMMGGPENVTLRVNISDSFADGPWPGVINLIPVVMSSYRRRRV